MPRCQPLGFQALTIPRSLRETHQGGSRLPLSSPTSRWGEGGNTEESPLGSGLAGGGAKGSVSSCLHHCWDISPIGGTF